MAENSERSASKRRRGPGRPFTPGVSGNPGGRPKSVKEVQELASTFTEEAVLALVSTMRECQTPKHWDPKEVRQSAVGIINRACGMPSQPITGSGGRPIEAEFPDFIAVLKKIAGEPADPPPATPPAPAEG